ncbi:SMP-30/gluconolactonase/LRE family protein [Paraglaciecola sp.]|uniref:SMP-30/gluconolactonase/LRE family protein n=1 Tax=Paraglaciecola sp. TaxID=1920173 RepID=UPI003EF14BD5
MKKLLILLAITTAISSCQSNQVQLETNYTPNSLPGVTKKAGFVEIFDTQALKYIDKDLKVTIRAEGFTWIEGPTWIEDGNYLIFSDIPMNRIMKYDPIHGLSTYMLNPGYLTYDPNHKGGGSNGLLVNNDKQLVLMQQGARQIAIMDAPISAPKHKFIPQVSHFGDKRLNSPNDLVQHTNGDIYFTDPTYGLNKTDPDRLQQLPFSGVYRLNNKGELSLLDKDLTFPNGIGLSPDEKTLYVAVSDKQDQHWVAYDVNEYGLLENKRRFYDGNQRANTEGHKGGADGLSVHSSGVIFATGPGGVWLFSPEAKLLAIIRTGQNTSNCTLTTNEDQLFITADDFLMSVPIKTL